MILIYIKNLLRIYKNKCEQITIKYQYMKKSIVIINMYYIHDLANITDVKTQL